MLHNRVNDPTDTNYLQNDSQQSDNEYIISDHNYGKNNVKILEVVRNGPIHSIKELMVCTKLTLNTQKDYTHGECNIFFRIMILLFNYV